MTTCVMWNGLREEQAPPHEGLLPKFGFVRTRTHTTHLAMRSRTTVSTPPLLGACMRVWLLHVDTDVCGCVHVQGCADLDVRFSGRQRKLDEAGGHPSPHAGSGASRIATKSVDRGLIDDRAQHCGDGRASSRGSAARRAEGGAWSKHIERRRSSGACLSFEQGQLVWGGRTKTAQARSVR